MTGLMCLAVAVFFEARGEPMQGKEAVANVIINRMLDKRYPNSVCGVVKEHKAFSYTHDGLSDDPTRHTGYQDKIAWVEAQEVAKDALEGNLLGITSTHYHTTNVLPFWAKHYSLDTRIGNHLFYTNDTPYK
jgi:spore germination cell wall hydrolase CwlJ-like protein